MWIPLAINVLSGTTGNFFHNFSGTWLNVYHYMHSLLIALSFSALVFCVRRKIFVPSLAWTVHVLCDAATHGAGKFENMPFYPLSSWGVRGISFWQHLWVVLTYWALLAIIWVSIVIWRRRTSAVRRNEKGV